MLVFLFPNSTAKQDVRQNFLGSFLCIHNVGYLILEEKTLFCLRSAIMLPTQKDSGSTYAKATDWQASRNETYLNEKRSTLL